MDAWRQREKRQDRRFALIAATLANVNRGKDDDPYDIREFMPMTEKERAAFEREKERENQRKLAEHLKQREQQRKSQV